MYKRNKIALGLLGSLTVTMAYAQVIPGSAQPQVLGQALVAQQQSEAVSQPASDAVIKQSHPVNVAESSKALRFRLNGIELINAHVFSHQELEKLYQHQLHQTITFGELLEIVDSITNYYRDHGYVTSQAVLIPQRAKHGIVKIKIIEAYVARADVAGNPQATRSLVQAYGNKIVASRPLNSAVMEKYLLLANEIPSTQVRGVLTPSATEPGASDLTLFAEHKLFNGYLSYDNYGTRYIGPQQITGNLGLNSFFLPGDSTQLTVAKTPKGRELTFIDLNYGIPVTHEGTRLMLGGTRVNTHPLYVLTSSDIDGVNSNYYTTLTIPGIRKLNENLTYLVGFNYNNTRVTSFDAKLYEDHIRSLGLGFLYNLQDRYQGTNSIYADFRKGLPIWGYTTNTNRATAETSRPGGWANYEKIDLSISRTQALKHNFSLYGLIKGQYGFQALLTAEQFAYGGILQGRGYDVAELLGDKGVGGTAELRYDWAVYKRFLTSMQLYGFYDIGKVWNYFAVNGLPTSVSAASAGAGIRFNFTKNFSGNLVIAKPLTKSVAAEAIIGRGHDARGFFSIVASV